MREIGLAPDILGELDERPLTLDEIHQLCKLLFIGEDTGVHLPLPPYQPTSPDQLRRQSWINSWAPFASKVGTLLQEEKLQWNPIKKRMTPWISMDKLQSILKAQFRESPRRPTRHNTSGHPGRGDNPAKFGESSRDRYSRADSERPRFSFRGNDPPSRAQSERGGKRWGSRDKAHEIEDLTLEEVIQRWSQKPPLFKRPNSLPNMLVTMPSVFPPINDEVEEHAYFDKWKKFDKEAFTDMSSDEMKPLLKRGMFM